MIRVLAMMLFLGTAVSAQQAVPGSQADLRVLDKVTGAVLDVSMPVGTAKSIGLLNLSLQECRAPRANPNGDAYALLVIKYRNEAEPVFQGWMIASAPALNAMDHPRYDVWVLRCNS